MTNLDRNTISCVRLSSYMQYLASMTPPLTSPLLQLSMVSRNVLPVPNLSEKKLQIHQISGQLSIGCIGTATRRKTCLRCCTSLPIIGPQQSPLTTTNQPLNLRTILHPPLALVPCKNS